LAAQTAAQTIVSDFTALLSGYYWNGAGVTGRPVILTYSFSATVPAHQAEFYAAQPGFLASFEPFNDTLKHMTRDALALWANACGITFVEAPSGQGDIQFGLFDLETGLLGFSSSPSYQINGLDVVEGAVNGDVFIDIAMPRDINNTTFWLLAHEIGHALGLKHPFDGDPILDPRIDNTTYTVMSYTGLAQTMLGLLDPQAVQYLYGPNSADASHVSSWSWDSATATLSQLGTAGHDTLRGVFGADIVFAGAGNDFVFGSFGNDQIHGEVGADRLFGGDGDDQLSGGDDNDVLQGALGNDLIDGGLGMDTASYLVARRGVVVSLGLTGPQETGDGLDTLIGVENLSGSQLNDMLFGNPEENQLFGEDGADLLVGNEADDFLNGGAGADALDGGAGIDTADYSTSQLGVIVSLASGTGQGGEAQGDTLAGIENLNGGAGSDGLIGNAAANVLNGGGGADYMAGGLGDDVYYADSAGDNAVELSGEGNDTIYASVSYAMTLNVETLYITGVVPYGVGNSQNNTIFGNGAANELQGLDGDDILYGAGGVDLIYGQNNNDTLYGEGDIDALLGGAGNDTLDGGVGTDYMAGGVGDDVYYLDSFGDNAVELAGEGADTIYTSVSYAMTLNVETMILTGAAPYGVGNAQNNIIYGNAAFNELQGLDGDDTLYGGAGVQFDLLYGQNGNDTLYGEDGDDALVGGAGNDTLDGGVGADYLLGGTGDDSYYVDVVSDNAVESPGGGADRIFAAVDYTITANVEELILIGAARFANGDNAANILRGNALVNEIRGLGGDDIIAGGGGTDFLYGGTGADRFLYTSAADATPAALDAIMDFEIGVDKVDLTAIRTGASDTFFFTTSGANTFLNVDLGGNGSTDLRINFFQVSGVTAGDILWG
jgi:Ca2+-binding RTX toxin-like protein